MTQSGDEAGVPARAGRTALVSTTGTSWTWEALFKEFSPAISGYARRRGVDCPEDLAQDVMVIAVEKIHDFHGDDGALRSWIFSIAYRRVIDWHRTRCRRPEVPVATDPTTPARRLSAEDSAVVDCEVQIALKAVAMLSQRERRILQLRIINELGPAEVAEIMGLRCENVRVIHSRAMAKARTHFRSSAEMAAIQGSASAGPTVLPVRPA